MISNPAEARAQTISIEELGGSAYPAPSSETGGDFGTTSIEVGSSAPDYHLVRITWSGVKSAYQNQGLLDLDCFLLFASAPGQTWADFITANAADDWYWTSKFPNQGYTYSAPLVVYRNEQYVGNFQSSDGIVVELKNAFYQTETVTVYYTTNSAFWANLGVTNISKPTSSVLVSNLYSVISKLNETIEGQAAQLAATVSTNTNLNTISSRVNTTNTRLSTINTSINNISTKITNEVTSNLSAISGKLDTISGHESDISDSLDALASDVSDIAGSIDDIETPLTAIDDLLESNFGSLGKASYGSGTNSGNVKTVLGNKTETMLKSKFPFYYISLFGDSIPTASGDWAYSCMLEIDIPIKVYNIQETMHISARDIMRTNSGFPGTNPDPNTNVQFGVIIRWANTILIIMMLMFASWQWLIRSIR